MMSLTRLEQDFQDYVLSSVYAGRENNSGSVGEKNDSANAVATNNSATGTVAARIEKHIVGTARVPIGTRLAIYSNAYRARLAEALENNYPMLGKLLGRDRFQSLAYIYIERHRSAHFSIRWYGDKLSVFLANESPYKERPMLAELADWEWQMTLAFDAADVTVLTKAALETVAPEEWADLQFKPHPSVKLLSLYTNAPTVWKALNRDEEPPPDSLQSGLDKRAELTDQGHHEFRGEELRLPNWIIWRRELDTFFRSLGAAEARALQAAVRGKKFGDICEELVEEVGEARAATEAARFLARWLEEGLLAAG